MIEKADRLAQASPRLQARIAGVLYLIIAVGALLIPFHVGPSGITGMTLTSDAGLATIAKVEASKPLYVLSGAGQLLILICDICVALILYELLKPVDRGLALLAAFFRLVYAAIAGANLFNHFAPLVLLSGADYLAALGPDQARALAAAFLKLRTLGFDISLVFFGVHCFLLGVLIFRSTFLPRLLGLALAIGAGFAYLSNMFVHALTPEISDSLFPYIMFGGVAEIALILWLIIVGVNAEKWKAQAALTV